MYRCLYFLERSIKSNMENQTYPLSTRTRISEGRTADPFVALLRMVSDYFGGSMTFPAVATLAWMHTATEQDFLSVTEYDASGESLLVLKDEQRYTPTGLFDRLFELMQQHEGAPKLRFMSVVFAKRGCIMCSNPVKTEFCLRFKKGKPYLCLKR